MLSHNIGYFNATIAYKQRICRCTLTYTHTKTCIYTKQRCNCKWMHQQLYVAVATASLKPKEIDFLLRDDSAAAPLHFYANQNNFDIYVCVYNTCVCPVITKKNSYKQTCACAATRYSISNNKKVVFISIFRSML